MPAAAAVVAVGQLVPVVLAAAEPVALAQDHPEQTDWVVAVAAAATPAMGLSAAPVSSSSSIINP